MMIIIDIKIIKIIRLYFIITILLLLLLLLLLLSKTNNKMPQSDLVHDEWGEPPGGAGGDGVGAVRGPPGRYVRPYRVVSRRSEARLIRSESRTSYGRRRSESSGAVPNRSPNPQGRFAEGRQQATLWPSWRGRRERRSKGAGADRHESQVLGNNIKE